MTTKRHYPQCRRCGSREHKEEDCLLVLPGVVGSEGGGGISAGGIPGATDGAIAIPVPEVEDRARAVHGSGPAEDAEAADEPSRAHG